jgi:hypothetical protein
MTTYKSVGCLYTPKQSDLNGQDRLQLIATAYGLELLHTKELVKRTRCRKTAGFLLYSSNHIKKAELYDLKMVYSKRPKGTMP